MFIFMFQRWVGINPKHQALGCQGGLDECRNEPPNGSPRANPSPPGPRFWCNNLPKENQAVLATSKRFTGLLKGYKQSPGVSYNLENFLEKEYLTCSRKQLNPVSAPGFSLIESRICPTQDNVYRFSGTGFSNPHANGHVDIVCLHQHFGISHSLS